MRWSMMISTSSCGREKAGLQVERVSGDVLPSRILSLALLRYQTMRVKRVIPGVRYTEIRHAHVYRRAIVPDTDDIGVFERPSFLAVADMASVGLVGMEEPPGAHLAPNPSLSMRKRMTLNDSRIADIERPHELFAWAISRVTPNSDWRLLSCPESDSVTNWSRELMSREQHPTIRRAVSYSSRGDSSSSG